MLLPRCYQNTPHPDDRGRRFDLPPAIACGHAPDHVSVVAWVTATARPGDTVLIMGARVPALPALARSILAALESLKARAGAPDASLATDPLTSDQPGSGTKIDTRGSGPISRVT